MMWPPSRKTLQLSRQIERYLAAWFPGEDPEPWLDQVDFLGVEPLPTGNMQVLLQASGPLPEDLGERLHQLAGELRYEISQVIHRKRAPLLSIRVLPALARVAGDD